MAYRHRSQKEDIPNVIEKDPVRIFAQSTLSISNNNFDWLSCFNRRLKDGELGKVISDVRNNFPTCKLFAERICKNIVDKCC